MSNIDPSENSRRFRYTDFDAEAVIGGSKTLTPDELRFLIEDTPRFEEGMHLTQAGLAALSDSDLIEYELRAHETTARPELLKAALDVEMEHIGKLECALRNLVHAARTSGGTAGRDEYLCQYCTKAELVLNYEYKRSAKEPSCKYVHEHPQRSKEGQRFCDWCGISLQSSVETLDDRYPLNRTECAELGRQHEKASACMCGELWNQTHKGRAHLKGCPALPENGKGEL
jgi:hypothetical protein